MFKEAGQMGAAVVSGIPTLQGLDRRPITDDFPDLSSTVAALLKFAAASEEKLNEQVPLLGIRCCEWQGSGIIETVEQVRKATGAGQAPKDELKVDHMAWGGNSQA